MKHCRALYEQTLFSGYYYTKQDKIVHLKLQSAASIRHFFSGGWLEWYVLGKLLAEASRRKKNYHFSCARSAKIHFPNEDVHELDVVFLPAGKEPLIIECKSGEYRRELDKYLALRKRLNIPVERFIILATDLDEAQSKSLSAMYQLTFLSPEVLTTSVQSLL